ncbi:MAG: hypothetical protein Kow0089_08440 [Desulfobulbaceae bacterium]
MRVLYGYLLTLAFAFLIMTGLILLISFCRRRQRNSSHGLSGMCHRNGGPACASCGDRNKNTPDIP